MLEFLSKATHLFLVAILTLTNVLSPLTGSRTEKITRANDDCRASFAAVSDTHLRGNFFFEGLLELGLSDMARAQDKLDAVVFNGDNTDHGEIKMWDTFADAISKFDIAKQTIVVTGNHDTWGPDRDNLEVTKQTFIKYNKIISDRDIDQMYYSTEINGYPVIVLGSEGDSTDADVSQAQIDWFAAEMEKASQKNLPIFIFFHQSINGTHGLPYSWDFDENDGPQKGGIGEASDDIYNIIRQYKNVFYVSGHIHGGFTNPGDRKHYVSVEKYDGLTLINLPSYMYFDFIRGKHIMNGTGYIFEIYDDSVMLRARNFITGTWISRYDEVIPLV